MSPTSSSRRWPTKATWTATPYRSRFRRRTDSGQSLSYAATGLPAGLSVRQRPPALSPGPSAQQDSASGPYAVTITASDATDSASTSLTWDVAHLSVTNPGDQTNAEGDAVAASGFQTTRPIP